MGRPRRLSPPARSISTAPTSASPIWATSSKTRCCAACSATYSQLGAAGAARRRRRGSRPSRRNPARSPSSSAKAAGCAARVLLAADGSDSAVRRLLDLPTMGHRYEQTAVVTHVTSSASHQETAWQRFLARRAARVAAARATAAARSCGRCRRAMRSACSRPSDAEFLAELAAASAGVIGELTACSRRVGLPAAGAACAALHRAACRVASATLRIRCTRSRGRA